MFPWFRPRQKGPSDLVRPRMYRFTPLPDITAFELALIMRNVDAGYSRTPLREPIAVDLFTVDRDWFAVSRHFTPDDVI